MSTQCPFPAACPSELLIIPVLTNLPRGPTMAGISSSAPAEARTPAATGNSSAFPPAAARMKRCPSTWPSPVPTRRMAPASPTCPLVSSVRRIVTTPGKSIAAAAPPRSGSASSVTPPSPKSLAITPTIRTPSGSATKSISSPIAKAPSLSSSTTTRRKKSAVYWRTPPWTTSRSPPDPAPLCWKSLGAFSSTI